MDNESKDIRSRMGLWRRVLLFLIGLLECIVFGGMVFGWPQLVLVLKQEGIYSNLCPNHQTLQSTPQHILLSEQVLQNVNVLHHDEVLHESDILHKNGILHNSEHLNDSDILYDPILQDSDTLPNTIFLNSSDILQNIDALDESVNSDIVNNSDTLQDSYILHNSNVSTDSDILQDLNTLNQPAISDNSHNILSNDDTGTIIKTFTKRSVVDETLRNLCETEWQNCTQVYKHGLNINAIHNVEHSIKENETSEVEQNKDGSSPGRKLTQEEELTHWKTMKCMTESNNTNNNNSQPQTEVQCAAQDERFALIFTVGVVCYALPSVGVGYLLHFAGLWVTRGLASLMLIASFVFLGLASPESPDYLFPAIILLGVGGNQLRLSAVQLGELFPQHRATAITLIMGAYSASSSVFFLFQVTADLNIARSCLCWALALIAGASFLATFIMPRYHVLSHGKGPIISSKRRRNEPCSLWSSVFSYSSFYHQYWMVAALFALNSYQQTFNYWVTATSCTAAEVRIYTGFFSFCGIIGAFVAPVLGYLTDVLARRSHGTESCPLELRVQEVVANFLPLLLTSVCAVLMYVCLLWFNGAAIYVSLVGLIVCRSCIFSTSTAFLRARFPAEHLDRLLGIYGTVASLLLLLQYPHFMWAMNQYYTATIVAVVFIALNFSYPFHLLYKSHIRRSIKGQQTLPLDYLCEPASDQP